MITLYKGDDTGGQLGKNVKIVFHCDDAVDMDDVVVKFDLLGIVKREFTDVHDGDVLDIFISHAESRKFPLGVIFAKMWGEDASGKLRTFANRIPFRVTLNLIAVYGSDGTDSQDIHVYSSVDWDSIANKPTVFPSSVEEVEGLPDALDEINGKIPKDASAENQLADKDWVDKEIDRVAAYYITSDAQGNPFQTKSALLNAGTYYSGGSPRTPTRNDYAIVLADGPQSDTEWRYIYSVNEQGIGTWEAQYPVEGAIVADDNVTKTSTNPVKSSGIWAAIWGALSALPAGFSSLYDWVVAQLRVKIDSTSAASIFTAKTYAVNDLCTYNSAVYRCKNAYTATASSAKPDADTTHWEAKPISDLFLPLAGGEIIGDLTVNGQVNVSAFFSIYRVLSQGLLFSGSINNVWRRALLPLSTASDSSISVIAFLQNIAPDYKETSTYELNSLCVYKRMLYRCTTAITNAEEWTAAHWAPATVEDVLAALRTGKANAADLLAKLDSTSAAPAFSSDSSTQYPVGSHCTYNGKLYKCTTATTGGTWDASKWTADTMTDPDAVLDITAQNQLRVVAKDGTLLWAQGYDLASTSSATLACDATNNFTFADGSTTQAFTLPTAPTGKVGDFGLDIDNSANTGAVTISFADIANNTASVVIPKGENLNDMLAIAAGERARFYISLSTFRVNNLPTWHIVKQVVENGGATA